MGTDWMSYEKAREFIRSQGIRTVTEFREWRKSENRPINFPTKPDEVYKEKWQGWKIFFGTDWMSYEEAREFIRSQGIRTVTEFRKWKNSDKRPINFPTRPDLVYKKEWQGWPEFFG
ncbi:MAG: hypothetical protein OXC37_06585, partial [Bdellovibrionaceae bacterium]|nr:hypothetical protein [Pseudobdellovibrionaceae bacterium]